MNALDHPQFGDPGSGEPGAKGSEGPSEIGALGSDEPGALVWRALASPVRRTILDQLRDGPKTTGELATSFSGLSRFAVMQHLRVLEEADLVVPRRAGRKRYNWLNPVPIQNLYDRWVARYMQPWTEALVSLRDELESKSRRDPA